MRLIALLIALSTPALGGEHWIRLSSPHFELYTDAGAGNAAVLLQRCEQIRLVFEATVPDIRNSRVSTRVYLFARESEFNPYRPGPHTQAFYQGGADRDYIVAADAGPETVRVLFHEYTHLVLNHTGMMLPKWLDEGLAEFYSTVSIDSGKLTVGQPIPSHLRVLSGEWLPASRLVTVEKESPDYSGHGKVGMFYAQSWAFVHMLTLSPQYRAQFPAFFDQLAAGTSQITAFRSAFGQSFDDAMQSLRRYVAQPLPSAEIPGPAAESGTLSDPQPLTAAEVAGVRAELFLVLGKGMEAAALYNNMLHRAPNSAQAYSGLAIVALRDRRYDDASRLFHRAIELGASDASTYFEYAMLLRQTKAPRDQVDDYLQRAVAANPAFAEAHFIIGVRASDEGRYSDAVEHLRRATEILPRQASFWHALAFAYHNLGQDDLARKAAQRLMNAATTPPEQEMARSAMALTEAAAAPAVHKPSVSTPASWINPTGDAHVEGLLRQVDCGGKSARLHVFAQNSELVLTVADPSKVVLRGARGVKTQFSCGPQPPTAIAVDYIAASREVTAIEFPANPR